MRANPQAQRIPGVLEIADVHDVETLRQRVEWLEQRIVTVANNYSEILPLMKTIEAAFNEILAAVPNRQETAQTEAQWRESQP